jgi:hypothetical protein
MHLNPTPPPTDVVALAVEFSECELGLLPAHSWGE